MEAVEGGEALFECYLSKPECCDYNWLIDDEPAKTTENTEMVYFENGRRHLLLLKNLTLQDSCRVTFMCSDAMTSAFLTVKGNWSKCCMGRLKLLVGQGKLTMNILWRAQRKGISCLIFIWLFFPHNRWMIFLKCLFFSLFCMPWHRYKQQQLAVNSKWLSYCLTIVIFLLSWVVFVFKSELQRWVISATILSLYPSILCS